MGNHSNKTDSNHEIEDFKLVLTLGKIKIEFFFTLRKKLY
jgi:hypothetical protein